MQTPAEKHLIKKVAQILKESNNLEKSQILNIGAGVSSILESNILSFIGNNFVCDRMDVNDCSVKHPSVGKCFIASVESMPEIKSNQYNLVFANYVLEHVSDIDKTVAEIHRVLKPSGYFIISLPNPAAPEFILSKYTPTKFHKIIRGGIDTFETHYAYKNIQKFYLTFEKYF